jgi:hypothetical protein
MVRLAKRILGRRPTREYDGNDKTPRCQGLRPDRCYEFQVATTCPAATPLLATPLIATLTDNHRTNLISRGNHQETIDGDAAGYSGPLTCPSFPDSFANSTFLRERSSAERGRKVGSIASRCAGNLCARRD